ncbi:10628_t:CDS:1, partial [Funneliformis geosporum]
ENSPIDYSARNEFDFSNRNSRMMSAKSAFDYTSSTGTRSILRANSPFDRLYLQD